MNVIKQVDTIISSKWILPIVPEGKVFKDCSLVIHQGYIEAILPSESIKQNYSSNNHVYLKDHLLMPGLVNAHGHAAMSLMRGMADDLPLSTWLQEHIWPAESRWVSEQFVEDGTRLAVAEMIKTGTTCFSDMYFYPEVSASVARQSGIRAQVAFPILDFPTPWANDAEEYIHKGLQLHDDYRNIDRISIAFGPHAPYTVSDEPLRKIAILADELQAPIQIHVHETELEVEQSIKELGVRPIKRLFDLGILTPSTQCVHVTQVTPEDIEHLITSGAKVVHCPESNMKLASGTCPITQLLSKGIVVGLGTDGAASNNDLDMFGELASAAFIAKVNTGDATAGNAEDILRMATLGGAEALGQEKSIGSLEIGKLADVIAINLSHVSCQPIYNIYSNLVYSNRHINVTHSWVEGKLLMNEGKLTTLNERDVIAKAQNWQSLLAG